MKRKAFIILLCFVIGGVSYGEELNIYNWSEYIDPALIRSFEKQTGIRVTYGEYDTDEILFSKLKGDAGYDLIVPSDAVVTRLIKGGYLQPLEHLLIPNLANLDTLFQNPPYDSGNRYSAAYLWGTVGLIWRKDKIRELPSTWASIFDPDKQPGPFVLLDDFVDMTGVALKYLGYSANTKDKGALRRLEALLQNTKRSPYFRGFMKSIPARDYVLSGKAAIAIVYNGEALSAMGRDPQIGYTVPAEGSVVWVDTMAIPAAASNPSAAHKFINFILEPFVGAQLSTYTRFATPNHSSLYYIQFDDMLNQAIYPGKAIEKRLEFCEGTGKDAYIRLWKKIRY